MEAFSSMADSLALADAALKITHSVGQVKSNKKRLGSIKDKVDTQLHELDIYCMGMPGARGDPEAIQLKDDLEGLRRHLIYIQARYSLFLFKPTNIISSAKYKAKAWWKREEIAAELSRLEKSSEASQSRFMAFRSARVELLTSMAESSSSRNIPSPRPASRAPPMDILSLLLSPPRSRFTVPPSFTNVPSDILQPRSLFGMLNQ